MDVLYVVMPALVVLVCLGFCWFCVRSGIRHWKKRKSPWRTFLATTSLLVLGVFALVLSAMTGFNAVALYNARHPAPGRLYQVDGRLMRMECTGAGAQTVVLEAGGGENGLMWSSVQLELSQVTRVCSYDRLGMGWSDTSPALRDSDSIAYELHALLQTANIGGSLVLVGASRGGLGSVAIRMREQTKAERVGVLMLPRSRTVVRAFVPGRCFSFVLC